MACSLCFDCTYFELMCNKSLDITSAFGFALPAVGRYLFTVLVFVAHFTSSYAQLGWGTPKMENPAAFSINFCEDNPAGEFQMSWLGVGSPATNPSLTVVLPPGITYQIGSIRDVIAHPGGTATATMNEDTLEIRLPNLTGGESGTVAFKLLYDCNADFSNPVLLDIAAVSEEAVFTDVSTPINNTFAQPQLVVSGGTNALVIDREVGDVFSREAIIEQTGQFSTLSEFTIDLAYESGLNVSDQTISDGSTTVPLAGLNSDGGSITISAATYPSLNWPFSQDDLWTVSEDVEIVDCDSLVSSISVNYGCGGQVCQTAANFSYGVALDIAVPNLTSSSNRTLPSPLCVEDGVMIEATFNMTGKAYNSQFGIETRDDRTYIDLSSVEVDYATGSFIPYAGSYHDRVDISPCGSSQAKAVTLDTVVGPIDGTSASQVYRIRYRLLTCCPNIGSCSINAGNIYGVNTNLFTKDMCGSEHNMQTSVASFNMNSSSSSRIPAFIADGETALWQYNIDAVYISNTLMNEGQVVLRFSIGDGTDVNVLTAPDETLPNGMIVSGGNVTWFNAAGSTSTSTPIVPLGGGNYEAIFNQGDFYGIGSKLYFPATYSCSPLSCGESAASEMTMGLRMGDGSCGLDSECLFTYLCESGSTLLDNSCCAGSCDGLRNTSFDVSRITYGIADDDNDGCADADPTVDMSLVSTQRALQGDELAFTFTGRVELNTNLNDSLHYVYYDLRFPDAHQLASNLTLNITDASSGATYSTSSVVVSPSGANSYLCYLATNFIRGSGTIPADFKWEDDDEISIRGEFTVLESATCGVEQIDVVSGLYGGRMPLPSVSDRLECNSALLAEYSRVGYSFDIFEVARAPYGCAGARYKYRVEFCIGGGPQGVQPFPYEIRNFAAPTQAGFEIPTGLVFDQLFLDEYRSSQVFGGSAAVFDVDITSFAKQADGYLFFDFEDWHTPCSASAQPNGGYRFDIHAYYEGSCNSERSQPDYYFEAELDFASPDVADITFRHDATAAGLIPIEVADLEPTTVQSIIYPYNQDAEWAFQVRELNNGNARNSWVMFASPSGGIIPTEIQQEGTVITAQNGIYQLGDIEGGSFTDFIVKAEYRFCDADSLIVYVGWDCAGYPNSASQVLAGGLPCAVDTLVLKLIPEAPGLQQAVTREPAGEITPCETFDYEIEIINTTNAILYEPSFELYVPYTAGIELDPSSAKACWPCQISPDSSDFNYNLFTPTETVISALGIRYVWDLETLIPSFDHSIDQGWPSAISTDTDSTRISISFEAETNCNFVAGDWMNFIAKGRNYCGEEVKSLLRNGVQLEYPGISPPYSASLTADPFTAFNICSEDSVTEVSGSVTFFDLTDGNDTLVIALPPSLSYSDFTFDPAQLTGPPVLRSYGPVNGAFVQEVRIGVNAGLAGGTSIPWSVSATVDRSQHLCDDPATINVRAVRAASIDCRGTTCVASAATSSLYPPPVLNLATDSILIGDLEVSVNCGMTVLTVDQLTIENTGSFAVTEDILVEFYYDADNSLDYSVGDVLIGDSIFTADIPVAGERSYSAGPFSVLPTQSCSIIAVASGCGCESSVGFVNSLSTDNAGDNPPMACSVGTISVGCGEDLRGDGFTYNWYGLDGAPVAGIAEPTNPNTTISFENFSDSSATFQYILVTEHPSGVCASADTVTLTFDGASSGIGNEIEVCPLSSGNMTGPVGFSNYLWSPTTGLNDPTDPLTGVVSPSDPIDYVLSYQTAGGCNKVFEQRVRSVVCTDLELSKEIIVEPSGVGSNITYSLVVTNQGLGSATGILVSDTLPQNLSFVSATPGGQYDESTHLWTIDDVLLPDSSVTLFIVGEILNSDPVFNVAEIVDMDQGDLDSTPGNYVGSEDDQDGALSASDIVLACLDSLTLGIPDNFSSYEWTRDGIVLSGEVADSLVVSSAGLYRVTVDGGQDPYGALTTFTVLQASCASIGDYVWVDTDGDGLQDPDEPALAGATVQLFESDGSLVATAITSLEGAYNFFDVSAGDYYLEFDPSTSVYDTLFAFTDANVGANDSIDSDASLVVASNSSALATPTFAFDPGVGSDLNWDVGLQPIPRIGAVKYVSRVENLPNGNIDIVYEIGILNKGLITLDSISVIDDLANQLGVGFIALSDNITPGVSLLSSTATVSPALNLDYTGEGPNTGLFQPSNLDRLAPGQQVWIQLAVEINPSITTFPIRNQVTVTGRGLDGNNNPLSDGTGNNITSSDLSDTGSDFFSTNTGEPGDSGGPDDPTLTFCSTAAIDISGVPTQHCAGSPIQLSASHALGSQRYEWRVQGDDEVVATTAAPTFSPVNTTTYLLTILNESAECFYDLVDSVTITTVPASASTPSYDYTAGSNCTASDLFLQSNAAGGTSPYTFSWTGPGNFSSILEDPVISAATSAQNGLYEVIVTNGEGCSSVSTVLVSDVVDPLAEPSIAVIGNVIPGESVELSVSDYSGFAVTYTWTTPGGTTQNITGLSTNAIVIDPILEGVHEGVYTVTVEVDGCSVTSESFTLQFNGGPAGNPTYNYTAAANCSASDLSLNANASGGNAPYTYVWTGPVGFTSTLANPIVPNANATRNGSYLVTITDALDVSVVASVEVSGIVDPLPVPVITSTQSPCEGGSAILEVEGYSGSSISYAWTTPGGVSTGIVGANTNQLSINPINSVLHSGSYSVTVNVDGCVLTSSPYELLVNPLPTVNAEAIILDSCHAGRVELQSNASSRSRPLMYSWTGPNGFASSVANPVLDPVSIVNNGSYEVTVSDANGCSATSAVEVASILDPAETPTLNAPSICEGDSLILASSASGIQYEWIGPNGASVSTLLMPGMTTAVGTTSLPSSSANYLSGQWSVRVTNADGCVMTSIPVDVSITSRPVLTTNALGPFCENDIVELVAAATVASAQAIDSISYAWYDADPRIVAGLSPVHIGSTFRVGVLPEGQHTYWAIARYSGCTSEVSEVSFRVSSPPVLTNLSGAGDYCEGDSILLSGLTVPGASFEWSGPNGFSYSGTAGALGVAATSVFAIPASSGAYTLESTSPDGCRASPESQFITISDAPATPSLTIDNPVVCEGQPFTLSSSIYTGVSSINYIWSFDDGENGPQLLASTTVPTLQISESAVSNMGTYSVQVEVDGCTSFVSNEIFVSVLGALTSIIPTNATTASAPGCEGTFEQLNVRLIPGASYQWVGPNNFTSQSPSPTVGPLTLADAGQYQVTISVNGCVPVVSEPTELFVMPQLDMPIISNSGAVCAGGEVLLTLESVAPTNGIGVSYEWYRSLTNTLVVATEDPFLRLTNLSSADTGDYYLIVVSGKCSSPRSIATTVVVNTGSFMPASAGEDQRLCAANTVVLSAQLPPQSEGRWTSLSGASLLNPSSPSSEVANLMVGDNEFIWTVSDSVCGVITTDTVVYTIGLVSSDAADAGENITSCSEASASLAAVRPQQATGHWSQSSLQAQDGVKILDSLLAETQVSGLEVGKVYEFYWSLSEGDCADFDRDTVAVVLNERPNQQAFVDAELQFMCDEEDIVLAAEEPIFGSGYWSTSSGARIATPNSPITRADGLASGENVFIWTLSSENCQNYSADSLIVVVDEGPQVRDELILINFGEAPSGFDIASNDVVSLEDYTMFLDTTELEGSLSWDADRRYTFKPNEAFVGETSFTYTYCHKTCEDKCATGVATFRIEPSGGCIIPSIITPNGDGLNDAFIVPCVEAYPESHFCVFNRWGDEVYTSENYKNDWEGTYKGARLPAGTYFYVLKINDGVNMPEKGYVLIQY